MQWYKPISLRAQAGGRTPRTRAGAIRTGGGSHLHRNLPANGNHVTHWLSVRLCSPMSRLRHSG